MARTRRPTRPGPRHRPCRPTRSASEEPGSPKRLHRMLLWSRPSRHPRHPTRPHRPTSDRPATAPGPTRTARSSARWLRPWTGRSTARSFRTAGSWRPGSTGSRAAAGWGSLPRAGRCSVHAAARAPGAPTATGCVPAGERDRRRRPSATGPARLIATPTASFAIIVDAGSTSELAPDRRWPGRGDHPDVRGGPHRRRRLTEPAPMQIADFDLERYFARWEFDARWLLCASDVAGLPDGRAARAGRRRDAGACGRTCASGTRSRPGIRCSAARSRRCTTRSSPTRS